MGIPVAIVASSMSAWVEPSARRRFTPLIQQTLGRLRGNAWWLSYAERDSYDAELRDWLQLSGETEPVATDATLEELRFSEQAIKRASRSGAKAPRLEVQDGRTLLIVWSRTPRESFEVGVVLSGQTLEALLAQALQPLLQGQPFTAFWNTVPSGAAAWKTEPLNSVQGLTLSFMRPAQGWTERNRWMGYGFVSLPMVMLLVGLVMTVRVIRQEVTLNQMQAKFIAAVSHELKSPITGIRLLMERIEGGRLQTPEATREYCAAIGRETDRLESLVNRLLETQKIQSAAGKYALERSSLRNLVEHAVQRLSPQAQAKGIRLNAHADAAVPDVCVDTGAIGDAIENLIDNAIKYSPSGTEVTIHISAVQNEARLEVCDQGIGIEKSDLPRIFDPFFRGRRGDLVSVKGTGLGLALVKAAAEAHGGGVDVSSAPDRGSRFTLRLPLAERT